MLRSIEIKTHFGICDAWIAQPEGTGPWPGIILCMDAVGPRPVLNSMAERLASSGFVVLMPNLFYRQQKAPLTHGIHFPVTSETISDVLKQIMPFVARFDSSLAIQDMKVFLDFLRTQPSVQKGKAGIYGYCMGGVMAIRTAAYYPDEFAAVATFHAGKLVTEDPESPHRLLPKIGGALYVAHADHDTHMTKDQIIAFEKALIPLSIDYEVELYKDAIHGFTMADLPAYNQVAAERHWQNLTKLFKNAL